MLNPRTVDTVPMPQSGDPCPGFIVDAGRCWRRRVIGLDHPVTLSAGCNETTELQSGEVAGDNGDVAPFDLAG
jgi:hypothetical protein